MPCATAPCCGLPSTDVFGKRTKLLGREVRDHLIRRNVSPEKAAEIGARVTDVCGKIDEKDNSGLKATTLYFVGPDEEKALYDWLNEPLASRSSGTRRRS